VVPDNLTMTCGDVRERLKPFLEDLLKDDERRAFFEHLEPCSSCRQYVKAVDSFSNQLWQLGEVHVPSDLGDTILFELKQAEQKLSETFVIDLKRTLVWVGISLCVALALWGVGQSRVSLRDQNKQSQPVVIVPAEGQGPVEAPSAASAAPETSQAVNEEKEIVAHSPSDQPEGAYVEPAPIIITEEPVAVSGPRLFHWHFSYSNIPKESDILRLRREVRKIEIQREKILEDAKQLASEIEALEEQKRNTEFEILSLGRIESLELEERKSRIEGELQEKYNQGKAVEEGVLDLEAEDAQVKHRLEYVITERKRAEGEPLNTITAEGVGLDYQDKTFLLFSARKDDVVRVREKMKLISEKTAVLEDFTPAAREVSDDKYQVSIYIEKDEAAIRHWHVNMTTPHQRTQFLDAVVQKGGVINYESDGEIIFSISGEAMMEIKAVMPAMRIGLSEYGPVDGMNADIPEEPLIVSVYFLQHRQL